MGVDIYGKAPRSEAGRYFAANWTAWRDLAGVCFGVAPSPCSQIDEKFWFSNGGRGLDDAGAIALADALIGPSKPMPSSMRTSFRVSRPRRIATSCWACGCQMVANLLSWLPT